MATDQRGFEYFGQFRDTYGSLVTVKESSAVGELRCWVFCGDNPHMENPTPHLNREQAYLLISALQKYLVALDDPENWRNSEEYAEAWGTEVEAAKATDEERDDD